MVTQAAAHHSGTLQGFERKALAPLLAPGGRFEQVIGASAGSAVLQVVFTPRDEQSAHATQEPGVARRRFHLAAELAQLTGKPVDVACRNFQDHNYSRVNPCSILSIRSLRWLSWLMVCTAGGTYTPAAPASSESAAPQK